MPQNSKKRLLAAIACMLLISAACFVAGCGGGPSSSSTQGGAGTASATESGKSDTTSGSPFERPSLQLVEFNGTTSGDAAIDITHVNDGYVGASAKSASRLKLEVAKNGESMYYDLPSDGTPIFAPLSMGNGAYDFKVWENTSGQKYALFTSTSASANMPDEFQPFLRPNYYCDFDATSESTKLANQLTSDAKNEGDVLKSVYNWVTQNISYDNSKAEKLAGQSGYVPNPDSTIAEKKGICFDYASLVAAMLRSQGIPCKIITGNVAPDDIYHAWNMIYIDGTWISAYIDVNNNTWTRIDTTFAASGSSSYTGDGTGYTDRYTY